MGLSEPSAFLKIGQEGLAKCTHHQLFECSKRLGHKGTSKLSKTALAERIWEELRQLFAPAPATADRNPASKAGAKAEKSGSRGD
ncbi:MAG TPA: hypothetical protein VF518_13885, partial [Polyangia bacterium]